MMDKLKMLLQWINILPVTHYTYPIFKYIAFNFETSNEINLVQKKFLEYDCFEVLLLNLFDLYLNESI